MGKHVHRLTEKNFEDRTAVCAEDGPVNIIVYGNTYRCEVAYREHRKRMKKDRNGTPRDLKKDTCDKCGFKGQKCQFDLDHINGDRSDHREENLWTLCANCHRLKSYEPRLFYGQPMLSASSPSRST